MSSFSSLLARSVKRNSKSVRLASALGVAALIGALVLPNPARASDETVTLTVHHFLSPKSSTHTDLILPWAERLKEQSGGRIQVEVFPSMTLGGKPPELYRQVRDGAADVVWTLIGYTPGVFPRSEVFELATVHGGSATATTRAIQKRFDLIADDYKDIHPVLIHVHGGNALHMRTRKVTKLEDISGLKLRTPSRTGAWLIEAYGAEPVGMPVPALPQAIAKGVVDGAFIPFEIMPPLKMQDLTQYSIEGPNGERFGTSVFMFAMNKERYEGLPDDLRAVIDANSGAAFAEIAGPLWDSQEEPGREAQRSTGGEVVTLDDAAMAAFEAKGEEVVTRWIEEATANGIDGAELVRAAREAISGSAAQQ